MESIDENLFCVPSAHDNCANGESMLAVGNFTGFFYFDELYYRKWFSQNWHLSIYASIIYYITITSGQKFMKNRKPFSLRSTLFLWNLSLSCFSLVGTAKLLPELLSSLASNGYYHSVCNSSYAKNVTIVFWIWLFTLSKLVEFGDTVFIVLRKQPLIFTHWIHHILTFIYCFFVFGETPPYLRWGITINYMIHAIMYFYYALKSIRYRVPNAVSIAITGLQITQMFVGIVTSSSAMWYQFTGNACDGTFPKAFATFAMTFFYFILFANFFVHRYGFRRQNDASIKQE